MFSIANCITGLNLLCGCAALVAINDGNIVMVGGFFCLALLSDFLDGYVARWLKQESRLGIELDSLADVISFGTVPGFMIFKIIKDSSVLQGSNLNLSYCAFIIPLFSAFRLARFNIETSGNTKVFQGLPVPGMAILISGIYFSNFLNSPSPYLNQPFILIAIAVIVSFLMISRIPVIKLSMNRRFFKGHWFILLVLIVCFYFLLNGTYIAISVLMFIYVIYSIIYLKFSNKFNS